MGWKRDKGGVAEVTYHKTLNDDKVIMDDLGKRSQAVGSARGIAVERKKGKMSSNLKHPPSNIILKMLFMYRCTALTKLVY